jgi:hypothetical protein
MRSRAISRTLLLIPVLLLIVAAVMASRMVSAASIVAPPAAVRAKATVSLVVGLGKLQRGTAEEERITTGMSVKGGDVLTTLKGARLEIKLASGSVARLGEQSVLRVSDVAPDRLHATIEPLTGAANAKIWVNASKAKGVQDIKVRTPVVLTAVKGTIFDILAAAADSAAGTRVRCYQGATSVAPLPDSAAAPGGGFKIGAPTPVEGPHEVSMEEFTVLVKAMQEVVFTRENLKTRQEAHAFDPEEDRRDEWVGWNQGLDGEPRK